MTLDAMDWVWTQSQSRGNTRLVLLYVADQVRTSECEVRLGHRQIRDAINASSKETVEKALKAAALLGELEIKEQGSGRRPALYRLPKAAGWVREAVRSAPENGARAESCAPETGAQDDEGRFRSAPKNGAQDSRSAPFFSASAPKNGAPPHTHKEQAGSDSQQTAEPSAFEICQPLINAMTQAGITVSWSMQPSDWTEIANIVRRAGIPAMVAFARDTKASSRQPIRYAKFFLRGGWQGLPPAQSTPTPQPGPAAVPPHCGHIDCDPVSRTRDTEDATGLRVSVRCPECHPARKDQAA